MRKYKNKNSGDWMNIFGQKGRVEEAEIGDIFKIDGKFYILSAINYTEAKFINIQTGNRLSDVGFEYTKDHKVDLYEIRKLLNSYGIEWKHLSNNIKCNHLI